LAQDVGWPGYTWVATLLYVLQACARTGKTVWVLDRPNPAGRIVEGKNLVKGEESFVGVVPIPQRHGLTLGELARYMVDQFGLDVDLEVIEMEGYSPDAAPGFGWPHDSVWINPSPAIANINSVRCYTGTVLLEGTNLSEGRGTTTPLEVVGAPQFPVDTVLSSMRALAPEWCEGCYLRPCFFQPFFDKYTRELCAGVQIHADFPWRRTELKDRRERDGNPSAVLQSRGRLEDETLDYNQICAATVGKEHRRRDVRTSGRSSHARSGGTRRDGWRLCVC
jgi:uncharacterized protein YbbC (DUF1343 family)